MLCVVMALRFMPPHGGACRGLLAVCPAALRARSCPVWATVLQMYAFPVKGARETAEISALRARGNIASFVAQESLFCVAIQPLLHAQRGSLAGAGFRGIAYSSFGFAKSGIFHFLSRVFDRALPQAVALRFPYIARDGVSRWERTASWPASKN